MLYYHPTNLIFGVTLMNSSSNYTITDRALLKRLTILLSVSLFVLISLYVFLFAPLYIFFANDVLYMSTVLPELLSVLSSLVDIFVFGIFYGTLLYAIYRFTLKKSFHLIIIFGGAVFYKNVGNLLMTFITDGFPIDPLPDFLNTAIYLILEILQCIAVIAIGTVILTRAGMHERIRMDAAKSAGKLYTAPEYFPFAKLVNFKNPIQKAAFWMASVPMLVKTLSRAGYDVWFTVMYGFYDGWIDILCMLLYYSLDVIGYGIVVYFIVIYILTHFHAVEKKLRKEEAETTSDSLLID